jgi:hypothetical protein
VVYWYADANKDLLVGRADGRVQIFLNTNPDNDPEFDGGTFLQVGLPGAKVDIDVGSRATSTVVDWNNDGSRDLVVGALDGKIHVYLNQGADDDPNFVSETIAQEDGADLVVPSARTSPVIGDFDEDGMKDLLTGDTNGQLLFYSNVGTDEAPGFSGYTYVEADGVPIDLPGTPRSRPFVCDWTDDGVRDVLIGISDGKVRLYQGLCDTDITGDGKTSLSDLAELLGAYGSTTGDPNYNPDADFDGDGDVDLSDLAELLGNYGCRYDLP